MTKPLHTLLYSLLLLLSPLQTAHAEPLKVSIANDVYQDYLSVVGDKKPLEINDYRQAKRSSTEALLLVQMLERGGFKDPIELLPFTREDYARIKLRNNTHILSATEWLNYINQHKQRDNRLISSAIIEKGEYKVGLYTHPEHPGLANPSNLSGLSATTHRLWTTDISTLNELKIDSIHFSNNYELMLKMVYSGRADLILSSFKNSKNMDLIFRNIRLTPIKGVQVALNDSRHWLFLNRYDTTSIKAHAALEAGIEEFRQQGRIRRAFTQSGLFNPQTADWPILNNETP